MILLEARFGYWNLMELSVYIFLMEVQLISFQGLFIPSAISLAVPLALMSLSRLKTHVLGFYCLLNCFSPQRLIDVSFCFLPQ